MVLFANNQRRITMLLQNVEISWVKFDSANPDMGFDKKTPQYSCTVKTSDKVQAEAWKKASINVKPSEEQGSVVYSVTLKKKIYADADGKNTTKPPAVVDKQLQPITNTSSIGNGSKGNVQVRLKPYDYLGKQGISVQLLAMQVTELKEYQGGDALEFAAIDTDTAVI
tara:strand:+ start:339 stop:842 length:504 start_codon:yes stop_codon:yes gene_type:complete